MVTVLTPRKARSAALEELRWAIQQSRAARLRTLREFAEQEIILPDGQYEGMRFRVSRQPYTALWLDEVDSGRWERFALLGPVQSGKTLLGCIIPTMYHLFEIGESVIFGVPTMELAADKWREDLRPAIEASRYRELLPRQGAGSKGGLFEAIQFGNGATLKLMSGRGKDEKRSAYTARVVVVTEADKMDVAGEASREADPISQLEARTSAYDFGRRIYLECTVSIEQGRIWQEYISGTESRIVHPCPHCREWVSPEREHLRGWQDAKTVLDVRENAHFVCPACGKPLTSAQRLEMNLRAKLLHKG